MEVRLEEAPEARLPGLLPGSLLTQWSHREELVEPVNQTSSGYSSSGRPFSVAYVQEKKKD